MAGGGSGAAAEGGASGGAGLGSTPAVASVGRNKKMCAPVVAYFRGTLDDYRYNLMVKELAQAEADIIETYRNKAAKAQSREERQSAENLLFAFQKERERVIALVGTPEEFEEIRKPRAPLVSYFPGHFVDCSYLSTVKSLAQAEADIAKYTERVAKAPMSSEERSMAEHLLRVSQDEKDSLLALVDTPEGLEEIKKPCAPSRWYYSGHFIRLDDDSMVKELAQAEADIAKYAEEVAKAPISSAERSMAEHLLRVSQDERERVILLLNRLGDPETEPLAEEPSGVGPGPVAEGGASGGAGSASTAGVSGFLSAKATFVLEFLRLYRLESQYFLFGSLFCNTRFLQELLQLPSPDAQFEKIKSHSDLKGTSRTATVVKKMLSQDRFHDLKSEFLPD
jgi:hypothetical protein